MKETKVCGDCVHWENGECFRFPPQISLIPTDDRHSFIYSSYPMRPSVTAKDRACGEWRPF